MLTGEIGPKPLICLFRDKKLILSFKGVVKKGVMALAFSPDGTKAACAGMDDDHHVAVLNLDNGSVIATQKGTKKVITKIVWTSNNAFVTAGISHFKSWTLEGKTLKGKESPKRYNFVSIAYDEETQKIFTGASKGTIVVWTGSTPDKNEISLTVEKITDEGETKTVPAMVVDALLIWKNYLLAGTKDGVIFIIDKKQRTVIKSIEMEDCFLNSDVPS